MFSWTADSGKATRICSWVNQGHGANISSFILLGSSSGDELGDGNRSSLWRNVSTSSPICSPFHISLTNKPSRTWAHGHGDTERTIAESSCKIQLHVTCPAVRKKKKEREKAPRKQHLLAALTASCFLLFSPAGHVLSG